MRILCAALCIVAVFLGPCFAQTAELPPWLGTWVLEDSSTEDAGSPRYKRVTLQLEIWEGDGLKATYDMVGTRGGVTHIEWSGRFNGQDYPVQGLDYVMTNAYTPIDARSYSILVKIDGIPRATTTVSISPDGSTLTAITTDLGSSGNSPSTSVYRRKR